MSERKVLNKYYPPDFDPAKLPKLDVEKNRQYVVRLMAPFTMRCLTCGNYIYKGKKFNSRKEDAVGEKYLGIQIYRFYIRCPQCLSEICFKTDPENTDYAVENGAYRTFQAERIAELEEERLRQEKEEEEANNPMLALENRTKESRREMDVLDALEEIRDWNTRNAHVKFEDLMERHLEAEQKAREQQEKEDEALVSGVFGRQGEKVVRRLNDSDEDSEGEECERPSAAKKIKLEEAASLAPSSEGSQKQQKSSLKQKLAGMIVIKKQGAGRSAIESEGTCSKSQTDTKDNTNSVATNSKAGTGSLSLLGDYTDSSSSEEDWVHMVVIVNVYDVYWWPRAYRMQLNVTHAHTTY